MPRKDGFVSQDDLAAGAVLFLGFRSAGVGGHDESEVSLRFAFPEEG